MPQPLPDAVVATLKADSCAALAAIMIISSAHPELLAWAQHAIGGFPPRSANGMGGPADGDLKASTNAQPGRRGSNGGATSAGARKGARAKGRHNPRESAARHDEKLLSLMRANPQATVTELIHLSERPRNSAVASLERLEKAGLVEHASRGKWTVADPDLLEAPAPKPAGWLEPLSGARVARHAAAQ